MFGEPCNHYRIIGWMSRTDLYVKIELEHGEDDQPQKLAAEICRQIRKVYGVRSAEISNIVAHAE